MDETDIALFRLEMRQAVEKLSDKIEEIHAAQVKNEKNIETLVALKNKGTGIIGAIVLFSALLLLGLKSWVIDVASSIKGV